MRRWLWPLITVAWCLGGRLGARTSRDAPTVTVRDQGKISGKEVTVTRAQRSTLYLGIPFAHSPTGDKRFAPPVTDPPVSWTGVKNGSLFGPSCMQDREELHRHDRLKLADKLFADTDLEITEDCLYLNIYLPDGNPPSEGWPVMIWFHSGNFSVGAASLWDASVFAVKQKVIVVTSSYRLNVFGFFTTLDGFAPGNFGMLDQVAAIDWVIDKIDLFGGSKEDIVLGGHSAGAESVALHMLSPLSNKKFTRAIAMSGSALTQGVIRNPQKDNYLKEIAEKFNCKLKPTVELLNCLREIPEKDLLKETTNLANWGPIIDAPFVNDSSASFLPGDPLELLMSDKYNKVDFMTGFTDMERALTFAEMTDKDFNRQLFESQIMEEMSADTIFEITSNSTVQCTLNYDLLFNSVIFFYGPPLLNEDASELKKKYLEFSTEKYYAAGSFLHATYVSKSKAAFLYRFDYKLKTELNDLIKLEDWMNVPHMLELPFIWGMPYWTSFASPITWNNADRKLTDIVMSLWGNFSKFSNPADRGRNVQWDPFTPETQRVLLIDKNIEMSNPSTFNYKATKFWNDYYPKLAEASYTCCNTTADSKIIRPSGTCLIVVSLPVIINSYRYGSEMSFMLWT
ncbi:liver carboxylesterase 1-like isoform X1 [Lycorma delicatula]|uniref:liver carboxylesterase 1-like isoform X1 n=1 Tax=Lycorma delicatula TaxID=130591 RepID=UPI003F515CEA